MRIRKPHLFLFVAIFFASSVFAQPTISSFAPVSGPVGTSVTITGTNFNATPANNIVFFGAVKANVTAASATSLTVTVPNGITYQPITVTVNGLTAFSNKHFIVTFSGGALTSNAFEFATNVDNVTGIDTDDMAIADLNEDGKPDIVVVDNSNGFFAVYRNTTTGSTISFAPRVGFQVGSGSHYLSITDIDGDGKKDVLVTNSSNNNVSVFRNTTTGGVVSFAALVNIPAGPNCIGITSTDFDGDGKADIATASSNLEGTITLIRNTSTIGTISFAPKSDITTLGVYSRIINTDIDNDNKPDLVLTNFAVNIFSVLRNTGAAGSITFAPKVDFATGPYPDNLTSGDIDGDGKHDVSVSYFNSNFISTFRNTTSGTTISFGARTDHNMNAVDDLPDGTDINDLDGDSKPDLSVINSLESIELFKNNSTTGSITLGPVINMLALGYRKISSCDFNADGKPELAVIRGAFRVSIWRNKSTEAQITSFTPASGGPGTTVTISGANFTGVTAVSFGGTPAASFTVVNSTTITAMVGTGASGVVAVSAPHGNATIPGFTFYPLPTISSFTPTTAIIGTTVTISGTNFTGASAVSFGGVPATSFNVVNSTTITAVVGSGASGNVSVTTGGGTAALAGFTYIPPPDIISFNPTTGTIGTVVTITGTNLSGVTDVRFGGIAAGSFNIVSSTTINATVLGGSSGHVKVTAPGGSDSLAGFVFISPPAPIITSFTPAGGAPGTIVTITGNNFNTIASLNFVYFGTVRANVSAATATTLTVTVPSGAVSQFISVTTNFLTAYSTQTFITKFPGGGNISNGSFEGPLNFITGLAPLDICISDIDGDGKNDLATISPVSNISIHRNTTSGTISFAPKVEFYLNPGSRNIRSAEIDGDGKQDIITTHATASGRGIAVYKNISVGGTITLNSPVFHPIGVDAYGLAFGDLDGDGKTDVAASTVSGLALIRNTGVVNNIAFAPPIHYPRGLSNFSVAIGDLDGDNKPDVAFLGSYDSVYVMRNMSTVGSFVFGPIQPYATKIDEAAFFGPTDLVIKDLDGDNKLDIAIANTAASKSISIYRNNSVPGTITFASRVDFLTGSLEPDKLSAEDSDGDGKLDLNFTHHYVPRTVAVLKNNSNSGTMTFAPHVAFTDNSNGQPAGICTGDLDGDGKPEIITTSGNGAPANLINVYRNKSDGPHVTSFTPGNGISGTVITITGSNFTGATAVSFGGVSATSFTVVSPTTITAVVGSGAAGNVSVTTPLGTTFATGFLYGLTPTITSFTPTSGATFAVITITGTNFTGTTAVSFGGVDAQSFNVVSSTTITAIVWLGASGNVVVTAPGGVATLAGFTYIPPAPVINSFSPQTGTTGTLVTISGSDFTGTSAVGFGGTPATSFTVHGPSLITATVGNGASGSVSVTTPGGTATKTGFTYTPPPPTISSFTPASGTTGTVVTITGTNFTGTTIVSFGGINASSFTVVNSTTLTATVAGGATGSIMITTPGGTATSFGFTYIPSPTIASFTPNSAATGATITITGTNFTGASAVSFGGIQAQSFIVNSATSITAIVGTGATGNVSVTTPGGTASLAGFTYNAVTGIGGPGSINSKELIVNPNPAKDFLIIKHPATNKNAELNFYDILGRKVKTILPARNSRQTDVILNYMTPGIYTIVWSDNTRVLSRILVIK